MSEKARRETTDAFCKKRQNNYKNNAKKFLRGENYKQQHLFEHSHSPRHADFIKDVCITFIDKTGPFIPAKREDYWRQHQEHQLCKVLISKKGYGCFGYICYFVQISFNVFNARHTYIRTIVLELYSYIRGDFEALSVASGGWSQSG